MTAHSRSLGSLQEKIGIDGMQTTGVLDISREGILHASARGQKAPETLTALAANIIMETIYPQKETMKIAKSLGSCQAAMATTSSCTNRVVSRLKMEKRN